jgi:hypothetical protein
MKPTKVIWRHKNRPAFFFPYLFIFYRHLLPGMIFPGDIGRSASVKLMESSLAKQHYRGKISYLTGSEKEIQICPPTIGITEFFVNSIHIYILRDNLLHYREMGLG